MSIADGQAVLRRQRDGPTGGITLNPQASISRIGSRAYHPAMAALAPQASVWVADASREAGWLAGLAQLWKCCACAVVVLVQMPVSGRALGY